MASGTERAGVASIVSRLPRGAAVLVIAAGCWLAGLATTQAGPPVPVIFDTDIMGDVDDVGAVAALHALADRGEAQILAMAVSSKHESSPVCLSALNHYFGRPHLPIGRPQGAAFFRESKYARQIAREFPHELNSAKDAPIASVVYRRALASAEDGSVVIISVGQLTNLRDLLYTLADQHSPLTGRELVAKKVKRLVCMGGKFPAGREANLVHDGPAAADAIAHWPTPILFTGWEIGRTIKTGGTLKRLPASSPVRRAYQLYNGLRPHSSWDQTAVLLAVRPQVIALTPPSPKAWWGLSSRGTCHVFPDGSNVFLTNRHDSTTDHRFVVRRLDEQVIAAAIEELMRHQPSRN